MTQLEVLAMLIGLFAGVIGMSALYVGLRRSYYHEEGGATAALVGIILIPIGIILVQYATPGV